MTIEWMEIDKIRLYLKPDPYKYIVLFDGQRVGSATYNAEEIIAYNNSRGSKMTHCAILQIPELPKKKLISFREALQVLLDGGKVAGKKWPEGNYLYLCKIQDKILSKGNGAFDFFNDGHGTEWIIIEKPPKKDIYRDLKEWVDEKMSSICRLNNDLGSSDFREGCASMLEEIKEALNE